MHSLLSNRKWSITTAGAALALLLMAAPIYALTRGFTTEDNDLRPGMAVAIKGDAPESQLVERISQENQAKFIGVAVSGDATDAIVASKDHTVFVQTDGVVEAFVTDLNGNIAKGNSLTVSPLKGMLSGLKNSSDTVFVVAEEDFSDAREVQTVTIQDNNQSREVKVGKIKVNLDYKVGSTSGVTEDNNSALQRLGRSIVGKDVSAIRVVVALVLFLVVLLAEGGIIYGVVSGAMAAMGRNPLARKIIHEETLRMVGVAMIVLLVGVSAVYFILWV